MKALVSLITILVLASCGTDEDVNRRSVQGLKGDTGAQGPRGQDGRDATDGLPGSDGLPGQDGTDGVGCSVSRTSEGALITCGDTVAILRDGTSLELDIIDPCGDDPSIPYEETLLRLPDGSLLAYFKDGTNEFLSVIQPGNYVTTDQQQCLFSITETNDIID